MSKPAKPIETGTIVDIKPRCMAEVRRSGLQLSGNPQFKVESVVRRDKWSWGRALVLRRPDDKEGVWLWTKQLHRVPTKKVAEPWKA